MGGRMLHNQNLRILQELQQLNLRQLQPNQIHSHKLLLMLSQQEDKVLIRKIWIKNTKTDNVALRKPNNIVGELQLMVLEPDLHHQ